MKQKEEGIEGGRKEWREGGMERGRNGGRERGMEGGRNGGREEWREGGREGEKFAKPMHRSSNDVFMPQHLIMLVTSSSMKALKC